MNRRNFIKDTAAFAALGATVPFANVSAGASPAMPQPKQEKVPIYSFSKLFQFLNYDELAVVFKESGIDGIDLTVRKGGHVEPENVEIDLPKAANAAQKQGLTVASMVTDIADADDPLTLRVIKTASDNGVKFYRLAYYRYDYQKSMPANLESFRVKMEKLGELNAKYNISGGYQNHNGTNFGGNSWEIWEVIKNMDKKKIGCFYDVYHGVVEGLQSWPNALRAIAPHITMRYIKDFYINPVEKNARVVVCELGKGIVNFNQYFRLCRELNLNQPICLHIEYELFTPEEQNSLSHAEKYKKALMIMKRDTDTLKSMIS
jgi:sugar phosphate isomerase/epimerase